MKLFDVQGIELHAASDRVFAYVADPAHLPAWTSAFATVANGKALMRTPQGEVEIDLVVLSSKAQGTIDWKMTFPLAPSLSLSGWSSHFVINSRL